MPTEQVAAGGLRFAVTRAGSGRPTLLLTDDVPSGPALTAAVGHLRAVLLADLPGLGGSEGRGDLDVDGAADAVAALVAHESSEPLDVVGHGLGGAVALRLCTLRPELVRRLVLLASPVPGGPGAGRYAAYLLARRLPARYGRSLLRPSALPGRPQRVLVVAGSADRVLPERVAVALQARLSEGRPAASVQTTVVPGAGHDLHRRQVPAVWGRVREFLVGG